MTKPQLIAINEPHKSEGKSGKCSTCGTVLCSTTSAELGRVFAAHVKERHNDEDVNQAAARIVREATER